jgi:hypothetical protein
MLVAREQLAAEALGEGNIRRIIGGEVGAECPDARKKGLVPVPRYGKLGQERDGEKGASRRARREGRVEKGASRRARREGRVEKGASRRA